MSYQILSLKYRPQSFDDVVGQTHVTQTLVNAFKKDRVAQGYIFTGPRGVGKTTTARIMAKGLNCSDSNNGEPCNDCTVCNEITESRNLDVLEIDGASNRGIEEIRNLRELIKFTPMNAPYKIFIIDEVHMLTNPAFNALLRTLEEPPAHGKFIMCTTDIHKLPATIISRCQRFDFHRLPIDVIRETINNIISKEELQSDSASIDAIARKSEGSMRDALSILDQVIAFSNEQIVFKEVEKVLGLIPHDIYFGFTDALKDKDSAGLLTTLVQIRDQGIPTDDILSGLNKHVHNLMFATISDGLKAVELNDDLKQQYIVSAESWDVRDLLRISQVITDVETRIKRASQPYIMLEIMGLKLFEMDGSVSIEQLLKNSPQQSGISSQAAPTQKKKIKTDKTDKGTNAQNVNKGKPDKTPDKTNEPISKHNEVNEPKKDDKTKKKAGLNVEELKDKWSEIITSVTNLRTSVGMVLEHCIPLEFIGKKAQVGMVNQPRFNLDLIRKNTEMIEDVAAKHMKQNMKINFFAIEKDKDLAEELSKNGVPQNQNASTKSDLVVDRVIELFDGEILR
jgi:DNA polymerase-3 subunit gamma/tau